MIKWILVVALIIFYAIRLRKSVVRRVFKKEIDRPLLIGEVLTLVIVIMQLSGYDYFVYKAPMSVAYAGLVLAIGGAVLASTARIQLKSNYVPAPAASLPENLVTSGLYRIIRHPSYLGSLLAIIGFQLAMNSYWIIFSIFILGIIIQQINKEEKMLLEFYKDEWQAYAKVAPYRLFPFVY